MSKSINRVSVPGQERFFVWQARDNRLVLAGAWTTPNASALNNALETLDLGSSGAVTVDFAQVDRLDTAGAFVFVRWRDKCLAAGNRLEMANLSADRAGLLKAISETFEPCEVAPPTRPALVDLLERMGQTTVSFFQEAGRILAFFGEVVGLLVKNLLTGRGLRFTSLIHHVEQAGLLAVPIICLVTFLIGAVLAFLGADILRLFGAQIFVTDLIAFAFLREFGVLLTAVMVAGRSGSAFTAQIGAMRSQEEVDAIRALGLDPIELLVIPRLLALLIALPLLTFIANLMGLFGGGLICLFFLEISPGLYLDRIATNIGVQHFWAGMIKAPVFAFLIALIGCYQGMQVKSTAESIGTRTTAAVVQSIFVVIIADAIFALVFIEIGF